MESLKEAATTTTTSTTKEKIDSIKTKIEKFLYEKNSFTDVLEKIEAKTKVKRTYLVAGVLTLCGIYLVIGYGASFLCALFGFLYPAYCSVKAIESESKDDDTQWLTYWVVYSAFSLVEFFSDIFLSWFPFYYLAKLLFLIWCMAPITNNGSKLIYNRFIKPFVLKHQKQVDEALSKIHEAASEAVNEAEEAAREAAVDTASRAVADSINAVAEEDKKTI